MVTELRRRHPGVDDIRLFGSGSQGTSRPDSDYDVVVVLTAVDEALERRIAADCERPEVDLFFASSWIAPWLWPAAPLG